ncbi:MAG: AMP-binding protein [Desulfatiglandales bacterium]|jgi:acyl-CoA synthetase (AMP-forming)/AMP-acid ligase II|nr:AMP-binding protein [Desulfatiglandales bacterium]
MNLVDILEKNAHLYPEDIAFVEVRPVTKTRSDINWACFNERTNRLANALMKKGVKRGEKVFLLGRNSIHWLEAYFAVIKTGMWVVPLNFRSTNEDVQNCAAVAEPKAFILDDEFVERTALICNSLETVRDYISIGKDLFQNVEPIEELIESASPESPRVPLKDEDACALYFTSGTTGAPKAVLLSHGNFMCSAIMESTNNHIVHGDRFLMMPPMYHLAIGHLLGLLAAGGRTVLLTEKIIPEYVLETIFTERISVVFLLVPWALDILDALDKGVLRKEDYDLTAWRHTHMGAQAIPPSIVHRLKAYFPDMAYDTAYGLSESTGPGVIHLGIENEKKIGAIGKPSLLWDARIVDDRGRDVQQGEVGELIVKGNGVMLEYYKNPALMSQTIRKGWLSTGDLAKMDKEGFIYLVDRKKDLVICGGENIYPVEVEEVIQRHPKIYDVAVIGTPDRRLGEIVTAVIATASGEDVTESEINAFCEEHLPRYKRPRCIIFDSVPRGATGKIEKLKLKKKYAQS